MVCYLCHKTCKDCEGSGLSTSCKECFTNFYLLYNTGPAKVGVCLQECPTGTFKNMDSTIGGICNTCDSTCLDCSNSTASGCLSCSAGRYLLNKKCETSCGILSGKFANTEMNICDNCATNCTSCISKSAL